MTHQEPKIISGFDRIQFLINDAWVSVPSDTMLKELVYFPKEDLYNLKKYRDEVRTRNYDSSENQKLLRDWSNKLIFVLADRWGLLDKPIQPKMRFEYDIQSFFNKNTGFILSDKHDLSSDPDRESLKRSTKIINWCQDRSLDDYIYYEVLEIYCWQILKVRFTADCIENPKKLEIIGDSLRRRFSEFKAIYADYQIIEEEMDRDKNIQAVLIARLYAALKLNRKVKDNKRRIESALGIDMLVLSQCIFCQKFHTQTTKKAEKGKTALTRYCPECAGINRRWSSNKNTPNSKTPLNGF